MRKTLFTAIILTAGAMPVYSASAALRPVPGSFVAANGAGLLPVREPNDAQSRDDREAGRHEDRGGDRRSSNSRSPSQMEAREAGDAPRGKNGPHDRDRGDHSSSSRGDSFDRSGALLTREPAERPSHDGTEHP